VEAGEVIGGRYELRGILGRGGMAEVREAWDRRLRRVVAVKLLHPGLTDVTEKRLRFEAEARAAGALASPHIVVVHDSGEYNGTPFIVMERLPGASLADEIARGPLPQPMVRDVLADVLAALAVAHDAGILHRDIKPGNILFSGSGGVKVTDFGIAKTAEAAYTLTGQIVGTLAYLSPERISGRSATVSDDIYAVGVVGYEALTGRRPFIQKEIGALAHAILTEQPPPIAALRPDVKPELAAVIERATARDPGQRFGSAREMRAALLGGEPPPAAPVRPEVRVPPVRPEVPVPAVRPATRVLDAPLPPPSHMPPPTPTYAPLISTSSGTSRARKLWAAGALVVALMLAVILLALDSSSSSPPAPVISVTSTTTPIPTAITTTTAPSAIAPAPEPPPPPRHPGKGKGKGQGD
jgi:serine/threonine-protein kinase